MSTIPDIRIRLRELSAIHELPELGELADKMVRRFNGRKGRSVSLAVTPALAADVKSYAKTNPSEPMHLIAEKFGINQGRVSEILFGKRH